MIMLTVTIVISAMGLAVLLSIILSSSKASYEQTAFASAERMRSAIDEACFKDVRDEGRAIEIEMELPQSIMLTDVWLLGSLTQSYMGRFLIRQIIEPNFILYYEMFPVGEAIGWELYHDFDYRIITQITGGESIDANCYQTGL